MGYAIEQLNDISILVTYIAPVDFQTDIFSANQARKKLIEEMGAEKVWVIVDMRQVNMTFAELVRALANLRDAAGPEGLQSSKIETIYVGEGTMVELGHQALAQDQYGHLSLKLVASIEEARQIVHDETIGRVKSE